MKKPAKIIVIALILIVIAAIIIVPKIFSTREQSSSNQRQNTPQQNQIINADGYVIKDQTLDNEIRTVGTIRANEEVEIRSEISRKIIAINFKEGSFVSKGQTLFRLDASDLAAKLQKLEIEKNLATAKFAREKMLIEKGLTSQEEYDISENTLEQIKADISIIMIDINKTSIRAPFSGIAGLRNVSMGSYVSPQTLLVTMQDISKVKIDFSIPEKYITLFKKGEKLTFTVDGIEGEFDAEIYAYEPKVENNTRTLLLRAVCSNPGKKLLPGTFADVKMNVSIDKSAILIPTQALIPKLNGQSIFQVKEGKVKLVDVEIGTRTEEFVQIVSSNLAIGDTIVTTNILRLKDGMPVKVTINN